MPLLQGLVDNLHQLVLLQQLIHPQHPAFPQQFLVIGHEGPQRLLIQRLLPVARLNHRFLAFRRNSRPRPRARFKLAR